MKLETCLHFCIILLIFDIFQMKTIHVPNKIFKIRLPNYQITLIYLADVC